jgi:hypothetical protein
VDLASLTEDFSGLFEADHFGKAAHQVVQRVLLCQLVSCHVTDVAFDPRFLRDPSTAGAKPIGDFRKVITPGQARPVV